MDAPDPEETARRVRAAMAYAGLKRVHLARKAHISTATLDRITGKRKRGAEWSDLGRIAKACDLPPEWFSADFERLHQIVPEGMPTIVRPGPPSRVDPATDRTLKGRMRREDDDDEGQAEAGGQQ